MSRGVALLATADQAAVGRQCLHARRDGTDAGVREVPPSIARTFRGHAQHPRRSSAYQDAAAVEHANLRVQRDGKFSRRGRSEVHWPDPRIESRTRRSPSVGGPLSGDSRHARRSHASTIATSSSTAARSSVSLSGRGAGRVA
jgi:hypothetical protein